MFTSSFFVSFPRRRFGFTLVELLVVITIISVLMGLLLVGISAARESARRAQCVNNQRDLTLALLTYATEHGNELPPLVGKKLGMELSWAVSIFPQIGEQRWYDAYIDAEMDVAKPERIAKFMCASDPNRGVETAPSSYVVNCGEVDCGEDADPEMLSYGLFLKDGLYEKDRFGKSIPLDKIKAGASNTILLTENLQATSWFQNPDLRKVFENETDVSNVQFWFDPLSSKAGTEVKKQLGGPIGDLGFRWTGNDSNYFAQNSRVPANPGDPVPADPVGGDENVMIYRINAEKEPILATGRELVPYLYARPSSNHPGIVVVANADGSVDTLNDNIEFSVYHQRCDPSGHKHDDDHTGHNHP